jgi:hypothetical protein
MINSHPGSDAEFSAGMAAGTSRKKSITVGMVLDMGSRLND